MNRLFLTSLLLLALTPVASVLSATPTRAQEAAPSEAQLQAPSSAMTTPEAAPQPEAVANTAGPSSNNDPCPQPKGALNDTPDDLAKVQEEIDRFTLCVQRAQLLERLNESALKNQETTDAALGYAGMPSTMMAPGIAGPQGPGGLAPLPAAAFEGTDVTPITQASAGDAKAMNAGAASSDSQADVEKPAEEEKPKVWTIREIYGSGSDVQARLISPLGDEVKASSGMKLPDGKTTVVRITPAGVTVRDGAGAKTLEWAKS